MLAIRSYLFQSLDFRTLFRVLATVGIPDARRSGPGIAWRERRAGPRHAAVWIRIRGQWRKGRIVEWITDPGGTGWDCLIMADEPAGGVPWQGRYIYDPATIRPRDGDTPPGELPPPRQTGTHNDANGHARGGP